MPIYRVKGMDDSTGRPREIVVEAPDEKAARESARRARVWSPQVGKIEPDEPIVETEVIVYHPHAVPESRPDMLRERPIITIALGVFLGMTMYSLLMFIVGAIFSN